MVIIQANIFRLLEYLQWKGAIPQFIPSVFAALSNVLSDDSCVYIKLSTNSVTTNRLVLYLQIKYSQAHSVHENFINSCFYLPQIIYFNPHPALYVCLFYPNTKQLTILLRKPLEDATISCWVKLANRKYFI